MQKWAGNFKGILIIILLYVFNPGAVWSDTTMQENDSIAIKHAEAVEADSLQSVSTSQDSTQEADKKNYTNISDINSFWELTKLGGGFRWAIYLVLAIGIALIVEKLIQLFFENYRSRLLINTDISSMTIEEITNLLGESPKNLICELFSMLLDIFQTTGQASVFHEEIANYIQFQQDRFNSFKGRLSFLSDTAGALGLLGTVWGMFQTFFGGNLEKQLILNGMGVALITTLMGLVVSIILNFFGTEIFTIFNKRLENLKVKADQFRIRIMQIEQTNQRKFDEERTLLQQEAESINFPPLSEAVVVPSPHEKIGPPHKLIYVSGDEQSGVVNTRLSDPFVVELLDAYDNTLPNQVIRFVVPDDQGHLANGGKIQEITTNIQGRALTFLTLGTQIGENIVKASALSLNGRYIEFKAIAKADDPASLVLISGNNQNAPAGSSLKEPFVVGVRDAYDNPIPNFQVSFKITMGNGSFAGGNSKHAVITDNNGEAQAYLILGKKQGFNRVIVTTKKMRRSKLEFQALGQ